MSGKAILLPLQSGGICSTAHNPSATSFFFFKKPPGSEPHRKQHLQARASADTDRDFSSWRRLWVTSKFTSCLALKNNLPPLLPLLPDPGLKRAHQPPDTARPAFLTSKPVLQSTFTPGVLFKARQRSKQTFSSTILEPAARKPVPQFAAAKPNQNMDALQPHHFFF